MECELAERDEIRGYWAGDNLLLVANGNHRESCWEARLDRNLLTISPPEFVLSRCRTSDVCEDVITPYSITEMFPMSDQPDKVTVHHADGKDEVQVDPIPTADVSDVEEPTAVRIRATSFESHHEAIVVAFWQIPSDGPEGYAAARIERLWVSRGGFVGRNQYHVDVVQLPWRGIR
jgi:hypothetical protein